MIVNVTPNYRLKTESAQYVVEERHIVDPTKAPNYVRKLAESALTGEVLDVIPRETYREVGYYALGPQSLALAIDYIVIRESIRNDITVDLREYIEIIRTTSAAIRNDISGAITVK